MTLLDIEIFSMTPASPWNFPTVTTLPLCFICNQLQFLGFMISDQIVLATSHFWTLLILSWVDFELINIVELERFTRVNKWAWLTTNLSSHKSDIDGTFVLIHFLNSMLRSNKKLYGKSCEDDGLVLVFQITNARITVLQVCFWATQGKIEGELFVFSKDFFRLRAACYKALLCCCCCCLPFCFFGLKIMSTFALKVQTFLLLISLVKFCPILSSLVQSCLILFKTNKNCSILSNPKIEFSNDLESFGNFWKCWKVFENFGKFLKFFIPKFCFVLNIEKHQRNSPCL